MPKTPETAPAMDDGPTTLDALGFYTLSDARAAQAHETSPLWRCELLVTDACNFRCPYCRGCAPSYRGTLGRDRWEPILSAWVGEGLRNVRFSGGEPTLHHDLLAMVSYCRAREVERVAISTNGARPRSIYDALLRAGVDDFSISLDACCASTGDMMAGGINGAWLSVIETIRFLAARVYVTVGVVLTDNNAHEMLDIVRLAHDLGVADVRIIPAAQYGAVLPNGGDTLPDGVLAAHPILHYRMTSLRTGRRLRGLVASDNHRCPLVLDDMAVVGGYHFPCIIYLREGGLPIGPVTDGRTMRAARARWAVTHDTYTDPICRRNCLDVCVAYNNRVREMSGKDG